MDIPAGTLAVRPVTARRFADVEAVFGPNGGVQGCWCMYWRRPGGWKDNEKNHRRLRVRSAQTPPPGLLGYLQGDPVGWVQVGRRSEFERLERSKALGAIDDQPVWSVNCFFIHRAARRRGVARGLLVAAIEFASAHGASVLEGYPVDGPRKGSTDYYTGTLGLFERAGFIEVARRQPERPIVRLDLAGRP